MILPTLVVRKSKASPVTRPRRPPDAPRQIKPHNQGPPSPLIAYSRLILRPIEFQSLRLMFYSERLRIDRWRRRAGPSILPILCVAGKSFETRYVSLVQPVSVSTWE